MPCKDYDTATMPCKDYVRRLEKRYNIIEQTTVSANFVAASWYVQSVNPADATSRGVPWAPLPVPPDVNLTISKRKWEDLFMRYRHELAVTDQRYVRTVSSVWPVEKNNRNRNKI